jgi:hypothetical protein
VQAASLLTETVSTIHIRTSAGMRVAEAASLLTEVGSFGYGIVDRNVIMRQNDVPRSAPNGCAMSVG